MLVEQAMLQRPGTGANRESKTPGGGPDVLRKNRCCSMMAVETAAATVKSSATMETAVMESTTETKVK